jgi:hypothetical protein
VCLLKFNTLPSVKNFLRISIALPAERLRFAARFFCQGSPLRSDERKLRGLDSADGEAPEPARKSICFLCSKVPLPKKQKTKTDKGANNADRNN